MAHPILLNPTVARANTIVKSIVSNPSYFGENQSIRNWDRQKWQFAEGRITENELIACASDFLLLNGDSETVKASFGLVV